MPFGPWPGEAEGAGFLVDIWAAGAADNVLNDNRFLMPSGELLFMGSDLSGAYPGYAYLENTLPGPVGDSRVASNFHQRYYSVGVGVGGFTVDAKIEHDPLWDGTFSGLGGLQITDYWGARQHDNPGNSAVDLVFAQHRMAEVHGFFDGPIAYPTPGFNSGASEHLWVDLYNDFTGGLFNHPAMDLNGYGQPVFNVISKATGVITAGLVLSWWNGPAPVAGDGPGIFFTNGTADPPLGIIANRLLTTATNGPTQLAFYTSSTGGTLGGPIATMDWTNGIIFNAPISSPGTPIVAAEISAPVDLTTPSTGTIIAPAVSGKTFLPVRLQVYVTVAVGALSTPATVQVKQGASTLLAPTTALTNSTAFSFGQGSLTQGAPTQATMLASTATTVDVTIGATGTGGFAYQAQFILTGYYV